MQKQFFLNTLYVCIGPSDLGALVSVKTGHVIDSGVAGAIAIVDDALCQQAGGEGLSC